MPRCRFRAGVENGCVKERWAWRMSSKSNLCSIPFWDNFDCKNGLSVRKEWLPISYRSASPRHCSCFSHFPTISAVTFSQCAHKWVIQWTKVQRRTQRSCGPDFFKLLFKLLEHLISIVAVRRLSLRRTATRSFVINWNEIIGQRRAVAAGSGGGKWSLTKSLFKIKDLCTQTQQRTHLGLNC